MVNCPHLLELHSCHNHPIPHNLYFHHHFLNTLLLDPQDSDHSQLHPESLHPTSPYLNHPLPNLLSRIQKLCCHFPFPANMRIRKLSFIHAFSISTVNLLNSAPNKTRSHGSCHICKSVWHEHGENMSWPKFSRKHYSITRQTISCKRFNDGLGIQTSEQPCCLKFEP